MHTVDQLSHLAERSKGVLRCATPHHHHLSPQSGSIRDLPPAFIIPSRAPWLWSRHLGALWGRDKAGVLMPAARELSLKGADHGSDVRE